MGGKYPVCVIHLRNHMRDGRIPVQKIRFCICMIIFKAPVRPYDIKRIFQRVYIDCSAICMIGKILGIRRAAVAEAGCIVHLDRCLIRLNTVTGPVVIDEVHGTYLISTVKEFRKNINYPVNYRPVLPANDWQLHCSILNSACRRNLSASDKPARI